ncbi:hypothetical protein Tco_0333459 [Tanacetum coccineum]
MFFRDNKFLYLHTPSITTTDFKGIGEMKAICVLSGAVYLCSPFNVALTDEDMNKGFNKVYSKGLGTSLSKVFRRHAALFKEIFDSSFKKPFSNQFKRDETRLAFLPGSCKLSGSLLSHKANLQAQEHAANQNGVEDYALASTPRTTRICAQHGTPKGSDASCPPVREVSIHVAEFVRKSKRLGNSESLEVLTSHAELIVPNHFPMSIIY